MHQDTYYYHNIPEDPRLQFPNVIPNPYPVQPNAPWSGNYIPGANLVQPQGVQNVYNCGAQLPPTVPPLSTAIYGTAPTLSWAHTVPSLMPWVTQGGEASVPDPVIRFTAPFPPDPCTSQTATSWELLNNLGGNKTYANMHLKRKSDIDVVEPEAPQKLCITEEKMAARMKELHISNKYSVPAERSPFGFSGDTSYSSVQEKSVTNLQQLEAMLKESTSNGGISSKSIVLAPEIQKLVEPEKIFARTFLDKVERPSMAVVVWQPQNKILANINNNSSDLKTEEKESDPNSSLCSGNNNNNFLSQQISAICNMNSSFKVGGINEVSNASNSEDVMDT